MNLFRLSCVGIITLALMAVVFSLPQAGWSQVQGWSEEKNLVQAGTIDNRVTTPSIAVSGENVYIVYRQRQIKMIRSTDRGKTWSEPVIINPEQSINNYPAIAVFGSNIVVVWSSFVRNSSGMYSVPLYYSESGNRGIDWSEPKPVVQTSDIALKPMFLNLGDRALLTWLETPLQETLGDITTDPNTAVSPDSITELFDPSSLSESLQAQQSRVRYRFFSSLYSPRSQSFTSPNPQPNESFGASLPHLFTMFGPMNNKIHIVMNENTNIKLYESTDEGQNWKQSYDDASFFDTRYLVDMKVIDGERRGVMVGREAVAYQRVPVQFFRNNSLNDTIQLTPPYYVRSAPKYERNDGIDHVVWEAGNQDQSRITYMRTDDVPPTSQIVQPTDPAVKERTITFGWTGNDNISYTERLMYSYSTEENQWSQPQSETTVTIEAPPDGEYTFRVRAEDVAGNIQDPVTEFVYNTFQSAPDTTWVNPPSPGEILTARSVTLSFASEDNSDSGDQITYAAQVDDEPWSDFQSGSEHTFRALSNGQHILRIRTQDSRGNIDPTPAEIRVTVQVDLELVMEEQPNLNTNAETSKFAWTAKDDTGRTVDLQCYYILNGQPAQPTTTSTSLELTGLEEGRYSIVIWGVDPSGDKTAELDYQWVVDRTPPETTASFNREFSNGKPIIQLEASDPNLPGGETTSSPAQFEYKINEADWKQFEHYGGNWITDQPLPFYAWGHTLHVRAIDRAGNIDESAATIDLRLFSRSNPYILYPVLAVLVIALLFLIKMVIPTGGGTRRKATTPAAEESAFDSTLDTEDETKTTSSFDMDDDKDDPYA